MHFIIFLLSFLSFTVTSTSVNKDQYLKDVNSANYDYFGQQDSSKISLESQLVSDEVFPVDKKTKTKFQVNENSKPLKSGTKCNKNEYTHECVNLNNAPKPKEGAPEVSANTVQVPNIKKKSKNNYPLNEKTKSQTNKKKVVETPIKQSSIPSSTKTTSGKVRNFGESGTERKEHEREKNFNLPFGEMIDEETLTLQDEVKSMFNPGFRSFVFNPLAPVESKFQECKTSKNETGICRYVQHCFLPSMLSSIGQFMNNVCVIEGRFIGVCCPEFPVSKLMITWQNASAFGEIDTNSSESSGEPPITPEECGVATNTRIIGGANAEVKAWPWMVALLNNKRKFFCGGSLINNRYVLTAAHCTYNVRRNEIVARVGEFDFGEDQGNHEDFMVTEIKRHGQYNRLTLRNDIALLKLHKPVQFSEFVKTICLPPRNKNYTGEVATLTGWGHVQGGISPFTSEVLQEASFPVVSNEACAKLHGVPIPNSLICTAALAQKSGACNGDSGGPLMLLDDENRWKVIGVVSWGRRGCGTEYPSVFTRVTTFLDWIREHAV